MSKLSVLLAYFMVWSTENATDDNVDKTDVKHGTPFANLKRYLCALYWGLLRNFVISRTSRLRHFYAGLITGILWTSIMS